MKTDVKIVIVEDDDNLRFLVAHRLKSEGYHVLECAAGTGAEDFIIDEKPDIVLLDWMLPGKQGSEICSAIRKRGFENTVIMMTAKAQDVDKIDAYNFGVSDYVTKPFNMDVLVALLGNKVKFFEGNGRTDISRFGKVEHHANIHTLFKDGDRIELTILENRILVYFLQNLNKVVSRDELMNAVWGYETDVNTRTLDMHIVRLRKKIEDNPDVPTLLQTVRGVGYKFVIA